MLWELQKLHLKREKVSIVLLPLDKGANDGALAAFILAFSNF